MRIVQAILTAAVLLGTMHARADKPITPADREHWSFVKPTRPAVPDVTHRGWVRNPIDAFILSALEDNDLSPAAEANRESLLRRVTLDLTGLPPSLDERAAFLGDTRPDAYDRLVDRLLASPRYGERWAQHWLDLARYADTDGFEFDQARPDAWRFRDWVVAALNADMPYDRFVRLQLAGDETTPDEAHALVATGFNRCYPDMVDLNDQALRRQNALNDITETTGLVFLGLTIGCARCHDHKSDPIRQEDFYRLQAFFTPARFRDDLTLGTPAERADSAHRLAVWNAEILGLQRAILAIETPIRSLLSPGFPPGAIDDETAAAFVRPVEGRSNKEVKLVFEATAKDRRLKALDWSLVVPKPTAAVRAALLARLERVKASPPPQPPQARGLDEAGPAAPPTYLLRRGEFTMKGAEVSPGFPVVLSDAEPRFAPSNRSTGRRSALAEWLTRPEHPLTARVIVNRIWQHHFGRGIVSTPSDFGVMGAEPTHPELLDWLATELVARGWSLKELHRLIVTSATYRQTTRTSDDTLANDPDDELYSRFPRVRLDGEAIRDSLLAVSGRLSNAAGGPPVFPELPVELTKLSSKGAVWPTSESPEARNRRSLYVFIRRNLRYPFFEAFDRPDANASCPMRASTTIAPQALTLLNSTIAHEAAAALAARIERIAGPDRQDRVRVAYRLVYAREPDAKELALASDFLDRDGSLSRLCLALVNANEFVYVP